MDLGRVAQGCKGQRGDGTSKEGWTEKLERLQESAAGGLHQKKV